MEYSKTEFSMVFMLYAPRYAALRQLLVQARLRGGLTQADLADRLQKAQSFVSKVETGERYLDVLDFIAWCEQSQANPAEIIDAVLKHHSS